MSDENEERRINELEARIEDLESRLAKLERSRYRFLGHLNASQAMLFDVWVEHLRHHSMDPESVAAEFREKWMKNSGKFAPDALKPKAPDPAALDLIQAEHERALELLSGILVRMARQSKKSDPSRSP